ncbi:head maturation protease, ClpP-related [Aureimonas mangrovi]|uniref:head maturation protease, ClpP-related n=1 Tax=Aureimonas mangrovi TaxID=2758041 RepID=UPI00163DABF5|nr:head maturation protease, ClpP-related [Aureimonas mangrovi]
MLSEEALKHWRPVQAAANASDTISILDPIGYDWWTEEGVTAKRIGAALRSIGDRPVTVQINSPGGDFFEGTTIYNMLRAHPQKVTVQILGIAASAAAVIAMAGDEVQIASLGFMMIHNTQWGAVGEKSDLRTTADAMEVFDRAAAEMFAERSGIDVAEVTAMLDATTYLSGSEAVSRGFADAVVDFDIQEEGTRNEAPALYRLEAALTSGRALPRSERRRLMKEITGGTPGAAAETVMPSADDDAVDRLRLAAARLSLTRA